MEQRLTFAIALMTLTLCQPLHVSSKMPHILFIVADDLGWNDVGWRNADIHTPTLDKMAEAGIIFNSSYVEPVCSPSRSSFMSGYFPFRLGLQHKTIIASQRAYLPADVITLPQRLRDLGYVTHMAGKWHLGFCSWNYTPTFRGFDSFYGFYNAREDYYNHTGSRDAYDFRSNTSVETVAKGSYSASLFSDKVGEIIKSHDPSRPLFIYLPFQSVHTPLQVPESYVQRYCSHVDKGPRQLYCGMVAALDEATANVTAAMQQSGLWDDTIVFFTTDNGGPVPKGADNWPLRGSKGTLWEEGTRGTAFIYSATWPNKTGYTYNGLFHAVDWYPTILSAAAGEKAHHLLRTTDIDGVSQWEALLQNGPSPRDEFVYNIDEIDENGAVRLGRYKLIEGTPGSGSSDEETDDFSVYDVSWGDANTSSRQWPEEPSYQLYDIDGDPTETTDIADKYPDVTRKLQARLAEWKKLLVPVNYPPPDPASDPKNFGGVWSPRLVLGRRSTGWSDTELHWLVRYEARTYKYLHTR